MPKIVDVQCGSSDISQSVAAKLLVSPTMIVPQALVARIRRPSDGSPVRSWRPEYRESRPATAAQVAR